MFCALNVIINTKLKVYCIELLNNRRIKEAVLTDKLNFLKTTVIQEKERVVDAILQKSDIELGDNMGR